MPKYVYIIDDNTISDDTRESIHSKIAVPTSAEAFKVMQRVASTEQPDLEWQFDFDHCNNARIVTLIAKGIFEFDSSPSAGPNYKRGIRTLSIEEVWMKA